jgi:hypothetical protein
MVRRDGEMEWFSEMGWFSEMIIIADSVIVDEWRAQEA